MNDDVFEHALHALQIGDLRPHVLKVGGCYGASFGAWSVALFGQPQKLTDLFQGKAKFASSHNEAKAPFVRRAVGTMATRGARRLRQEADLFVVAHGLDIAARPFGKLSPLEAFYCCVTAHRISFLNL
ncbi:hypothetical protein GGQ90_004458 [Sphingobium scionense]|uniref:Uncharacterized protein n=1 Tax=Sphingobium scionense TaxID=1404341 RepID=A0A7W6LUK5_9SPHN|nr:hypothetical protein [Sphingobium scionense]